MDNQASGWGEIGSALQYAANFVGSQANNRKARKHERNMLQKQMDFAVQQSDLAYQRSLENWNMSNEYNSPREQMARLKAGGLNPNLAYGSGNVGGMSSGSPEGYKPASSPNFLNTTPPISPVASAGNALQAYQDFRYKDATIRGTNINNAIQSQENWWRGNILNEKQILLAEQGRTERARGTAIAQQAPFVSQLAETSVQASKANVDRLRATTQGISLENDLNELLKPYGLTSRDNVTVRQIARLMQSENPNVSALDVMLLLPTLIPGLKAGASAARTMRSPVRKISHRPRF